MLTISFFLKQVLSSVTSSLRILDLASTSLHLLPVSSFLPIFRLKLKSLRIFNNKLSEHEEFEKVWEVICEEVGGEGGRIKEIDLGGNEIRQEDIVKVRDNAIPFF